ncbi:NAD(P)H-binding protein [Amycolatopsis sp. QT-25]|uniref:NAD-dependent epimerase/dehydratase family protein n=1 Tax=Amycolatopsis sp. QT-25 TaxID=3034022 RepID=UPI0023ED2F09|nr:NAD(P)H-binding protein [Amycolatopsis sp. QT-25]WET78454.1 NAD(P)H-binding protein [Amycolatopsis sp. QT-25]
MRVMVTGVLGRPLVRRLPAEGHEVSGLTRGVDRVVAVRATGAKPVRGSLFDVDAPAGALHGHDAVVNVATRIPDARHGMTSSDGAENDRVRIDGSRTLADVVRRVGELEIVVQEGIRSSTPTAATRSWTKTRPSRRAAPSRPRRWRTRTSRHWRTRAAPRSGCASGLPVTAIRHLVAIVARARIATGCRIAEKS